MISKRSLCFIAVLFAGLPALAQSQSSIRIDSMILNGLRRKIWLPQLYFQVSVNEGKPMIIAYNGVGKHLLAKRDSLSYDARQIVSNIISLVGDRLEFNGESFAVYYFDKQSYRVGNSLVYMVNVKHNQITEVKETILGDDFRSFPQADLSLIPLLHTVPLLPSQYMVPFYSGESNGIKQDPTSTLCIVNLEAGNVTKDLGKVTNSYLEYERAKKCLQASKSLKRIIIRFQNKFDKREVADYPYQIR